MTDVLKRLGRVPVAEFMRRTWQRQPRLIRSALPGLAAPIARDALFALARRDDVESRLVTCLGGRWNLGHGPFSARALPSPRRAGWTLLVQGVDLHVPAAEALREQFRFVPDARLDDVMVSWASDGGGVGPHVDSYDVFLLQAQGRRRWRISRQRDLGFVPGLPLRILADFRPTHEWELEPGDLLYLPPGVAHEGTAVGGDCITCSIGFRAPAFQELLDPWFDALAERARLRGQYRDPGLPPTTHPAQLPAAMIEAAHAALARVRPTRTDSARALLTQLSEPKPQVSFDAPARPLSPAAFARRAAQAGLRADPRTRMLYAGAAFAINGELHAPAAAARRLLARLADSRRLSGADCARVESALLALLHGWHGAGWLHFDRAASGRAP
jgi:50S ribosomal protein L16 3-hydroxylase